MSETDSNNLLKCIICYNSTEIELVEHSLDTFCQFDVNILKYCWYIYAHNVSWGVTVLFFTYVTVLYETV